MEKIINTLQTLFFFEKEPQKIGLTQFKEHPKKEKPTATIKNKIVKLSDLMRGESINS